MAFPDAFELSRAATLKEMSGFLQRCDAIAEKKKVAAAPADERAAMIDAREIVLDWQAEHGITLTVGAINDLAHRITQSNKGQK
ncbi:hypothetical protein WJ30_07050 [Burkholderia diffusa]|nr:hypothetical protein WJ30_07050 [Burkholderia diffusa]